MILDGELFDSSSIISTVSDLVILVKFDLVAIGEDELLISQEVFASINSKISSGSVFEFVCVLESILKVWFKAKLVLQQKSILDVVFIPTSNTKTKISKYNKKGNRRLSRIFLYKI